MQLDNVFSKKDLVSTSTPALQMQAPDPRRVHFPGVRPAHTVLGILVKFPWYVRRFSHLLKRNKTWDTSIDALILKVEACFEEGFRRFGPFVAMT